MPRLAPTLLASAVALGLLAGSAAPAAAGEPIMPLSEVRSGMQCEGRSVIRGTAISTFGVEVLDVIAGDPAAESPLILMRSFGPAVDRTGLGPGFSGSPISCDGRVIGAGSYRIGDFGGDVGLATPIERIIGEPLEPPVGGVRRAPATMARARPLRAPLSVSGLSPAVGAYFSRVAARRGALLVPAPAQPLAARFPPQALVPGASVGVGLTSGDIGIGGVGTVSYTDGDRVWAYGHPVDGTTPAGRRALFLQDAYVYTVVENPLGVQGVETYKLAASGHDLGTLSGDGPAAVVGRLGAPPPSFPLRVTARDADTGRTRLLLVNVADEQALDLPVGASPLAFGAPAALAQGVASVLGGLPARQTGTLTMRVAIEGRRRPLEFSRRYVVRGAGEGSEIGLPGVAAAMIADAAAAVALLDAYTPAALRVARVDAFATVRRGARQAFLLGPAGGAAQRVRRGRTNRVRVRVQPYRAPARTVTLPVRVPRSARLGERTLVLTGTGSDSAGGELEVDLGELLFGDGADAGGGGELGPRTVGQLAAAFRALGTYDGVTGRISDGTPYRAFRGPATRLSGRIRVPIDVRR